MPSLAAERRDARIRKGGGNSLTVQWLGCHTSTAESTVLILGWGNKIPWHGPKKEGRRQGESQAKNHNMVFKSRPYDNDIRNAST